MSNGFKLAATAYDEGYKKGAAEMRERAAQVADAGAKGLTVQSKFRSIAAAIRALPLEPDK